MKDRKTTNVILAAILSGGLALPAVDAGAVGRAQQVQLKVRIAEVNKTVLLDGITVKESRNAGFKVDWDLMQTYSGQSRGGKPTFTLGFGLGSGEHSDDYEDEGNIGLNLDFFPTVSGGGNRITLKVLEKSGQSLGNVGLVGDRLVLSVPRTVTRDANTMVVVAGGKTLAVGGLSEVRQDNYDRNIPVFGSVPVVGRLFKADVNQERKSELVIFITPKLVRDN